MIARARHLLLLPLLIEAGTLACSDSDSPDAGGSPDATSDGGVIGCAPNEDGLIEVGGVISSDTTWACTQPYLVTRDVSVEGGATLTIAPGVTVRFAAQMALLVGSSGPGAILADGTASPIRFTSNQGVGSAGGFEGIVVDANTTSAVFRNVVVEFGGDFTSDGSTGVEAGIAVIGSSAEITGSTFRSNNDSGVAFVNGGRASVFANNTFEANTVAAIRVGANELGTLSGPNSFGAGEQIYVVGGPVRASATWRAIGAPYRVITADIVIDGTASAETRVTIEPGVSLAFESQLALIVGNMFAAAIVAEGEAARPIVFQSAQAVPAAGDWEGVIVDGNTVEARFRHIAVSHAGDFSSDASTGTEGGLSVIGAAATIVDSTFTANNEAHVRFLSGGRAVELHDNSFAGTLNAIRVGANALRTLSPPNTFDASARVLVEGEVVTESGTWANLGAPYQVSMSDVEISGTATPVVTVAPGVTMLFETQLGLFVGFAAAGGLVADASAGAPIRFGSAQPVAAAGDWEGVVVDGNATMATFRNVRFENAGDFSSDGSQGVTSGLAVIDREATITGCTFTGNDGSALLFLGTGRATTFDNNTFSNNTRAITAPAAAVASLSAPNTFDAVDRVEIAGGTVTETGTWSALGAPYRIITDDVRVEGPLAPVLTLSPNVTIELDAQTALIVGSGAGGTLIADGTTGAIRITSAQAVPAAGDWEAVVLDGNSGAGTLLRAVRLEYCGDFTSDASTGITACLGVVDHSPIVENCAFADSSDNGIMLRGTATAANMSGNTFTNITGMDIAPP